MTVTDAAPAVAASSDSQPADRAPTEPSSTAPPAGPPRRYKVPEALLPWEPADRFSGWMMTLIVTVIAGVTRFWNIAGPRGTVFDEVYYATESQEILRYGYENNPGYTFIVHPPLGKWLIGFGVHLGDVFNWDPYFGWRFSSALAGTLCVLLLTRIARRVFRSDLLGATAGLLLTMEGVSLVESRLALLDIFMPLFALAGFGALVLDRDQLRGRLAGLIADGYDLRGGPPALGPRPWRLVAGAMFGFLCAVKWSGLSFWVLFAIMSLFWDRGAFRSAGVRYPWSAVWRRSLPGAFCSLVLTTVAAYLLSWLGWIVGENSWNRHWAETHSVGGVDGLLPKWLQSLAEYHHVAYDFHIGLTSSHPYGSKPWSWLILGRPTNYWFYGTADGVDDHARCGATKCASQILLIGTPLMWWAFVPVLLWLAWHWLTTRDYRAGAVLVAFAAGWGAWLKNTDRTMFLFYMTPLMPFLVLGLTLALGTLVGRSQRPRWRSIVPGRIPGAGVALTIRTIDWRLLLGVGYVAVIVADFVWMWPVWTDVMLTYNQWHARMWFESWI